MTLDTTFSDLSMDGSSKDGGAGDAPPSSETLFDIKATAKTSDAGQNHACPSVHGSSENGATDVKCGSSTANVQISKSAVGRAGQLVPMRRQNPRLAQIRNALIMFVMLLWLLLSLPGVADTIDFYLLKFGIKSPPPSLEQSLWQAFMELIANLYAKLCEFWEVKVAFK